MIYTWFPIFVLSEFLALGRVSHAYTLVLDGIGEREILATKGELVGITYEGVFLTLDLNEKNPFEFDGHAVYVNDAGQVYLGIAVDET